MMTKIPKPSTFIRDSKKDSDQITLNIPTQNLLHVQSTPTIIKSYAFLLLPTPKKKIQNKTPSLVYSHIELLL